MPRIDAPTVVEHHARQRRALLDAARTLLAQTGQEPSMVAVGRLAGLARSSVYQYFSSTEDLLHAVVADVFPDWTRRVQAHVGAAASPEEKIWAYIEANVRLFTSAEQALAQTLIRVVEPAVLRGPMTQFHAELQVPLRDALTASGESDVRAIADMIDALIVHASRAAGSDDAASPTLAANGDQALRRLRRLLGGYLQQRPSHDSDTTLEGADPP